MCLCIDFISMSIENWPCDENGDEIFEGPYTEDKLRARLQELRADHFFGNNENKLDFVKQGKRSLVDGTSEIHKCAFFHATNCPWQLKVRMFMGNEGAFVAVGCWPHDHSEKGNKTKAISAPILSRISPSKTSVRSKKAVHLLYPHGTSPDIATKIKRKLGSIRMAGRLDATKSADARNYGGLMALVEKRKKTTVPLSLFL